MTSIYKIYCSGQTAAVAKVDIKCTDKYFEDFLQQISMRNEFYYPLTQYLAKPIQRILKYPILIEQMLKSTPDTCEDLYDCEQAWKCAKSFCGEIDDQLDRSVSGSSDWEPYENLCWLQTHLIIKSVAHLIDFNSETQFLGPRALLNAGFLQNVGNKKIMAAFLLNDLFILAFPQKRLLSVPVVASLFKNTEALQTKYLLYRKPFLLDDLLVTSRSELDLCIELCFNSIGSSIKLQATTFDQFKKWIEMIDRAKQTYCHIQKKNDNVRNSVSFITTPIAILSLDSIQAIQLYTRSCKYSTVYLSNLDSKFYVYFAIQTHFTHIVRLQWAQIGPVLTPF